MDRLLNCLRASVWALLLLVGCAGKDEHAQEGYFPENVFSEREDLHTFINEWYSRQLRALQEPSLYKRDSKSVKAVFRFTWLRTFHHPVSVRLEILPNGAGRLHSKMTSGAGGYEPGKLKVDEIKEVEPGAVEKLLGMIDEARFWELPATIEDMGLDGAQWIIEGLQGDRYHVVDRWSPDNGPVRKIGLFLLDLSDLDVKEVY